MVRVAEAARARDLSHGEVRLQQYEAVFDGPALRRDGTDEFEITVYGSRRNQLGPFYVAGGVRWPIWTGNAEMDAFASAPRRALVPFGLGAGVPRAAT